MQLGKFLENYITEKRVTHRQLARELDTSHTQVFLMLENKSLPKPETMKKICKVTGISMEELRAMCYRDKDGETLAYLTADEKKARDKVKKVDIK